MAEQFMNAGEAGLSVPRHIAIILDGNGRWARKRALPRTAGHAAGSENFRKIATYCKNIGVQYLTVYAFSTENWSRPAAIKGSHDKGAQDGKNRDLCGNNGRTLAC